ncbi:DUF4810 domain-containing protein [Paraglaciecola psychrophila]|nr:DUF4810 domain-containing protein [Paraglaciecola psychrophila]
MELNKVILCVTVLLLAGCASNKNQYYWGAYEDLVYKTHHTPSEVPPSVQIETLLADIDKAEALGKSVAPGVYAHLGFMYAADGNKELAMQSLIKEKELFPESATFINGIIQRSIPKS